MKELDLVINNATGLHARPAKTFVKLAKKFSSSVKIQYGDTLVNGKSLIGVLKLGVKHSGEIRVIIDGSDESEAAEALQNAVESGLGETPHTPHSNGAAKPKPKAAASPTPKIVVASAENQLVGIPASAGVAIGPVWQLRQVKVELPTGYEGVPAETSTLSNAISQAQQHLHTLRTETATKLGEEEAAIFEAHLELLNDPEIMQKTEALISEGQNAAQAWSAAVDESATVLSRLQDENLAARAADIRDVGQRVLYQMLGQSAVTMPSTPFILLADDLSPSMTASLDKNIVLAICTSLGGPNAHAAILARAFGLPAIVGLGNRLLELADDTHVIVDATKGRIETAPSDADLQAARDRQVANKKRYADALAAAGEKATTLDGHYVEVVANVGGAVEAADAFERGAEGVGLLRTEFLFLERQDAPSVDQQAEVYGDVLAALQGQPVIIRTLDVGGDKPLPYIDVPHEDNPFLGERGIRLCLNRPALFNVQLKAIAKASSRGKARVMFPMVSDLSELLRAREMLDAACAEIGCPSPEVGIMIEVPSAAIMADVFAPHIDFFSIGTNDLTQYTLAIDRMHPLLTAQADGLHPAVLRLIDMTVRAAHAAGKWVGICGELGADTQAVPILVGLGVDELSVNVPAVPMVKAQIRELNLPDAQALAQKALASNTAESVRKLV